MELKTFQEIRKTFPNEFLLLFDTQEQMVSPTTLEVLGAKEVYAYASGEEMFAAYKDYRRRGLNVRFCTPDYKDRLLLEQIPTLGIFGS